MITPKRRMALARAQAAQRQREKARGLVRLTVTVPKERKAELEALVGQWLLEAPATVHVAGS